MKHHIKQLLKPLTQKKHKPSFLEKYLKEFKTDDFMRLRSKDFLL